MKSEWVGCITKNPEETILLGENFADFMEKGDVYAFIGELASGKTTFIKGILKGLQFENHVTSPTFTLVNEYDAKYPLIHIDCYREDELVRWIKLGMNDYMNEENIVIIVCVLANAMVGSALPGGGPKRRGSSVSLSFTRVQCHVEMP